MKLKARYKELEQDNVKLSSIVRLAATLRDEYLVSGERGVLVRGA